MWTLTRGVEAKEVADLVTPTTSYDIYLSQPKPKSRKREYLPRLNYVLKTLTTSKVTVLSFKELSLLGTVSDNVFTEFSSTLSQVLVGVPKLQSLTLCSPQCSNSLPQCSNSHLRLLGAHCPELTFLDVSFNKSITAEGIAHLAPDSDTNHPGCVKLEKLFIFDCGVFEKDFSIVKFLRISNFWM